MLKILKLICQYGAVSIKVLSNLTGMSIPSITQYVEKMAVDGVISEQIPNTNSTGRKPKIYSLNPNYGYFISIDMGLIGSIHFGVFDFEGKLVIKNEISYETDLNGETIINKLIATIKESMALGNLPVNKTLCIVIGNPGVVDTDTGAITSMSARPATWANIPLKLVFQKEFGVNTKVMNDVNLSAIGEKEYGMGKGYSNFFFIRNDVGLKSGIIINNRLYQGDTRAAGEIGQNVIITKFGDADNPFEITSAESLISLDSIYASIIAELDSHQDDTFFSMVNGDARLVHIDIILKVLGTKSFVSDIVSQRGKLFGYVLLNVVTTLDISLIIVSGDITRLNNYYFKPARDLLSQYLQYPPTILISSLGNTVALEGGYAVGLEYVFDSKLFLGTYD